MLALQIIAAHLLGDYILQNDYMAQGKKKSNCICTLHVSLYMVGFLLIWPLVGFNVGFHWVLFAIFIQHWIQDRTNVVNWWMQFYGQRDFAKPPCAPWSMSAIAWYA